MKLLGGSARYLPNGQNCWQGALSNFGQRTPIVGEAPDFSICLETMLDGFVYGSLLYDDAGQAVDWIYLGVNPAFQGLVGQEEVVGKTGSELPPGCGDCFPVLLASYTRVAASGNPEALELEIAPLSRWVRVAVSSPALGSFFAVFEDITQQKKLEAALQLTQLSVDKAADLIYWIDPQGHLLYVSDSTCRRHGYSREEMLQMTVFDLDPLRTRRGWAEHWEELREKGSLHFERLHLTREGKTFPVEITANFVRQGGGEYNISFARDITERKRMERELRETAAALQARNRELEEAGRHLRETCEDLEATRDALAIQARTDPLSGRFNRGAILERMHEELSRAERQGTDCAIALLDIDHFKSINDVYGHPAGDRVLCEVAARCVAALRPYDAFGRFGGEEFLVVLPGVNSVQAAAVLERVRAAIAGDLVIAEGHQIPVTVSIGGAVWGGEAEEDFIRRVDRTLYKAKAEGRNCVRMAVLELPS